MAPCSYSYSVAPNNDSKLEPFPGFQLQMLLKLLQTMGRMCNVLFCALHSVLYLFATFCLKWAKWKYFCVCYGPHPGVCFKVFPLFSICHFLVSALPYNFHHAFSFVGLCGRFPISYNVNIYSMISNSIPLWLITIKTSC